MAKRLRRTRDEEPRIGIRWIIAGLILLGLAAIGTRLGLKAIGLRTRGETAWTVHLDLRLHAAAKGARIMVSPPWDSPVARLYGQQLTLDGLQLRRTRATAQREILLIARRRGEVAFSAAFSIRQLAPRLARQPQKAALTAEERQRQLGVEAGIDPGSAVVQGALGRIGNGRRNPGDLARGIFDYVHDRLAYDPAQGASTASQAIATGRATDLGKARAMVALCRAGQLPARVVTGFALADDSSALPLHWVQVHTASRWIDYDPTRGFEGRLADNYVAFSRDAPLVRAEGASILSARYQISPDYTATDLAHTGRGSPFEILDLDRLSHSARVTLATLLLLPLGALLNTFVRSVVGVRTFGTFTPAMLALAAIYVDWLTAVTIFLVVAVIALFGRSMLPGLNLSRAPRLTIVFALVSLAMALAVSIMEHFDLLTGARVVLLPIVILTSLVDRVYAVVDEQGLYAALLRLLWTGITAVGCFFILHAEQLGEWLVKYPELHLVTIALVLAFAAYRGPRLVGVATPRERAVPKPEKDKPNDAA